MASKEKGRDAKTKWGLAKVQGEAGVKGSFKEMSTSVPDIREQMRGKDPAEKWLFTKEQLQNTPSRKDHVTPEKELNYRQQAANLIQDMGQRLPVNQLTINTAIVYMHRFYMFHSFQAFSRFVMAPTALFLAAKVEEQPRKLEHVIKVCHSCLHPDKPHLDVHADSYLKQAQELVQNELIMLQTLGFDISIDHPHTHVVKCTQLVKASRDLSQMAYFMATNSLHLTTFCLKYKPTVVSAMCIHLSCKWSNYEIPLSSTGKAYWTYMDPTITEALLENIINEFLKILNLCPTRLRKLKNYKPSAREGNGGSTPSSKDGQQPKPNTSRGSHSGGQSSQQPAEARQPVSSQSEQHKKHTASMSLAEYKNKREKELQSKTHTGGNAGDQDSVNMPKHKGTAHIAHHGHKNVGPPQRAPQGTARPQHAKPGHGHPDRSHSKVVHPAAHGKVAQSGVQGVTATSQIQHLKQEKASQHVRPHIPPEHNRRPEKPHQVHPRKPAVPPAAAHAAQLTRQHHPVQKPATQSGRPQSGSKELQRQATSISQRPKASPVLPPEKIDQKTKDVPTTQEPSFQGQGSTSDVKPIMDEDDLERQIMKDMKAEKISENKQGSKQAAVLASEAERTAPDVKQAHPNANHSHGMGGATKEHHGRQGPSAAEATAPAASHAPPVDTSLYEQYKKDPESLRRRLKRKALAGPLNEQEKLLLHKCKKKDEERQKRKQHKKRKSHHSQSSDGAKLKEGQTPPGGGPLTVRIKLPPSVRAEMSEKGSAGTSSKVVGSSSGSGSEAPASSPGGTVSKSGRKRAHGHDGGGASDASSAKQSRKSDGHHHQSHQHHGSHESSRSGKHRHSRSGSHHHHRHHSKPHQSSQKIDEAMFQRALEDAVSMVQSGQASSSSGGEKPVPTVTLKIAGAENGSNKHRSKRGRQGGFDPSMPVSATLPDELFEGDEDESKRNGPDGHADQSRPADLSSPETGEIRDDDDDDMSPLREHVSTYSTFHSAKEHDIHSQRRANANNNNMLSSSHYDQRWSENGAVPPPPLLTHVSRGNPHPGEVSRDRDLLPPLPPLKPGRTLDQR